MRKMNKTTAMMMAMLFIGAATFQMIRSGSLFYASSAMWMGFLLMLATLRYAGGRSPRKALAALSLALVCGVIALSGRL